MNLLLSYIATHLLTIVEQELVKSEPTIVAMIVKEIQLLITKLESFIEGKSTSVATVVDPVIDEVSVVATDAVNAAGTAAAAAATPQSTAA